MTQPLPSLGKNNMRRHWICYRKLTALWMWLTLINAKEINSTCSFFSTTWHYATRSCKCLRNAHSALSRHWITFRWTNSTYKKRASRTECVNYKSWANSNCSIVPFSHRSIDIKTRSNNPKKESGSVIRCSMTWNSCVSSISRGKSWNPTAWSIWWRNLAT